MKSKNFISLFLIAFIIMAISCKKDEIAPETERKVPKATIKGKVWADLDVGSNSPGMEEAPSGIKIIARIYVPDLAGGIEVERVPKTYVNFEATVNNSGEFSMVVDASTAGLEVTLISDDFSFNQKQGLHPADSSVLAPIRRLYTTNTQLVSVIAGGTSVRDIFYNTSR